MRASAALLRLVIAVSLMLDGIGTAFASVQVSQDATGHMAHAAESATPPCHEGQSTADVVDDRQAQAPQSDCCQPGSCSCPCTSHTSMALIASEHLSNRVAHPAGAHAMTLGHAAPALPNLIRPPIG